MKNYKTITTIEAAFERTKTDPSAMPDVSKLSPRYQKWLTSTYLLAIVAEAVNTDENGNVWEPDWNNDDQPKYQAWFGIDASEDKPSGFGFSGSAYGFRASLTGVGSRLCFETREQVAHVQKHFKDLFLEHILILK